MTEHVFETVETDGVVGIVVDGSMVITGVTAHREKVVRCRACRCFDAYEPCDVGWCSGWECLTEADGFCHLGEEER